jgi:hypothetical protein
VEESSAGGGARDVVPAVRGGGRSRAEGEAAWTEKDEASRSQKDPFAISQKVQGSLCKLKFPTATKS